MSDGAPHVVVVGGSSGIGRALVDRMLANNQVTVLSRRKVEPAIQDKSFLWIHCDVSDYKKIPQIIDELVAKKGKISKLIYCAGIQIIKPLRAYSLLEIEELLTVNLLAAIIFGQQMTIKKNTEDDFVFCGISSISADRPERGIIPYSVAKAGLEAFIRGLAIEIAPRRVIGIAPGWLETEMTKKNDRIYDDRYISDLRKNSPLGIATVDSVADLIEYLISDKSKFITGQIIKIDGGISL